MSRRTAAAEVEIRTPLILKESTSIAAAEYDWKRKTLRVRFKAGRAAHRGGTYDYFDVPEAVVRDLDGRTSPAMTGLIHRATYSVVMLAKAGIQ